MVKNWKFWVLENNAFIEKVVCYRSSHPCCKAGLSYPRDMQSIRKRALTHFIFPFWSLNSASIFSEMSMEYKKPFIYLWGLTLLNSSRWAGNLINSSFWPGILITVVLSAIQSLFPLQSILFLLYSWYPNQLISVSWQMSLWVQLHISLIAVKGFH